MNVKLHPYAIERTIQQTPALVRRFLNGEFRESLNALTVKIQLERFDTGQGMSYKNRLVIMEVSEEKPLYDSGMLTYRDGHCGSPDNWDLCYRKAGLLEFEGRLLLGIETGTDKVSIFALQTDEHNMRAIQLTVCDMRKIELDKKSAEGNESELNHLRTHFRNTFNHGEQYPWTIGTSDFDCDLGKGFMAYHNGRCGRGGEEWDKFVVVLVHDGKPYMSDFIQLSLRAHDSFYLCEVRGREVTGNKFKVGFVCRRHDSWAGNYTPTFVKFKLEI